MTSFIEILNYQARVTAWPHLQYNLRVIWSNLISGVMGRNYGVLTFFPNYLYFKEV